MERESEQISVLPLAPWEGPAILLVDLDAFFASVEQLDHPGWRGKPVIVGGFEGQGVVQESLFDVGEVAPAPDDVEPAIADAGKRRGLIEATDKVKDRFGETAVHYGRELRNQVNTTGSAANGGDKGSGSMSPQGDKGSGSMSPFRVTKGQAQCHRLSRIIHGFVCIIAVSCPS